MLTSLSSLITLHLTDWGSLSIWCLLVWLKCWQANSLWETSLLLPRHWRSGRAAKPTWMFMWALRASVIMLACHVLFPLNHVSSPHFYILFGWLVVCFFIACAHMYACAMWCTCGGQKATWSWWFWGLNSGHLRGIHFTCETDNCTLWPLFWSFPTSVSPTEPIIPVSISSLVWALD